MNKQIISFIMTAALAMPGLVSAFEQKQNGITLKVTDYAQKTTSVLSYTPDGVLIAEKFLAKGIHPIRITIKNDTDKPIMISGRSTARLKCIDHQALVDVFAQDLRSRVVLGIAGRIMFYVLLTEHFGMTRWLHLLNVFLTINYYLSAFSNKREVLSRVLKDLTAQEELRYPEVIQPGKKVSKLLLIDERIRKNNMIEFNIFDEKHEAIVTKFEVRLT